MVGIKDVIPSLKYVQPRDIQRVIPQSIFICSYTSFHSSYNTL